MLKTILLAAILISTPLFATSKKMLYGTDDRYEVDSFYVMQFKQHTKSIATMAQRSYLWERGDSYKFAHISMQDMGLPNHANFSSQPTLGSCSGFLVAEDILVTAGHCVMTQADCDENLWVFDYTLKVAQKEKIKKTNTAGCKEVLEHKFDDDGWIDYSIVRLDKKFTDRPVLKVRSEGEVKVGTPVVMIGHPNGLPMKVTKNAEVWFTEDEWVFSANLDAYTGNSGSPVINANTGVVEGILVRGGKDFIEQDDGSLLVNICLEGSTDEHCTIGEDITKIMKLNLERFL